MKSSSPTLEGFRLILREPLFGIAEITWRWSFGAVFWMTLVFAAAEYLKTLPVGRGELLLLRTRQPVLVADAFKHIFHGSGWRMVESIFVLSVTLSLAWIALSSLARTALIKSLLGYFRADALSIVEEQGRIRLRSMFGLNFFRMAATLAVVIGFAGTFLFASAVSSASHPAPGSAVLVFLTLVLFLWLAWSVLNWFLSLAAMFVVVEKQHTFQAIASAIDLCRTRTASVLAVGTWFGLGHIVAFVLASSVIAFPLGFAGILPAGVVLGGVILVTLLYFAVADFLYIGRLAAYVAILQLPETSAIIEPMPINTPVPGQSSTVDQSEVILSDVPTVFGMTLPKTT